VTAFILAPYKDRVEILTDGANYAEDGTLLGVGYKVNAALSVPLAVVGSGIIAETNAVAMTIIEAAETTGSVDEALAMLSKSLAVIAADPNRDTGFRMAIGAISEADGPVCYVFSSFDEPGWPAFEMRRMQRAFAQGCTPTGQEIVAYGDLTLSEGLETDAVFLFESMRRQKMVNLAIPDREPFYSVGGHIDLTIIRADGYEQRRLHEWHDVVGEKIDPFPRKTTFSDGSTFSDGAGFAQ